MSRAVKIARRRSVPPQVDFVRGLEDNAGQTFGGGGQLIKPVGSTQLFSVQDSFLSSFPKMQVNAILYINSKLFLLPYETPCNLMRFNTPLSDLSNHTDIVLSFGDGVRMCYAPSKAKIYVVFAFQALRVVEIDPITLTETLRISDTIEFGEGAMITDNTYLYLAVCPAGAGGQRNLLRRYRLSDYGLDQSVNLGPISVENVGSMIVLGGKLYINTTIG